MNPLNQVKSFLNRKVEQIYMDKPITTLENSIEKIKGFVSDFF